MFFFQSAIHASAHFEAAHANPPKNRALYRTFPFESRGEGINPTQNHASWHGDHMGLSKPIRMTNGSIARVGTKSRRLDEASRLILQGLGTLK